MSRKTYRVKLHLDGWDRPRVYRTDGVPTHCCSLQVDYFCWEKNTKYNGYQGWSGYVSQATIQDSIGRYNPDNLKI